MSEEEQEEQEELKKLDEKTADLNKSNEWIIEGEIDLNELFKKYFKFQKPGDMLMYLKETSDKTKNNELVSMINSGLKDLKEEIKKIFEKGKEI